MKSTIKKSLVALFTLATISLFAQQPQLQYFRANDASALNVFETSKENSVPFTGVKVRVGGDFAIQYQGITQENPFDTSANALIPLATNINLPTANLNLDVQLHDGVRLHMRTYMSSRHHVEAWVKGGYMQIDRLNFISDGFLDGLMDYLTIRVGMDEINYGDVHFRRSDNARAIFNPFVGNYIMDGFTTEPFFELTGQMDGFIAVAGISNGRLNQTSADYYDNGFVTYGKLGYDKQLNDDLRVRLTASYYNSTDSSGRDYLYAGDRSGARYYHIYETAGYASDFSPRFNPGWASLNAIQINPFVKFKGLEVFGVYEKTNNGSKDANGDDIGGSYTQIGAELLYRFWDDRVFVGGRYNAVSGEIADGAETQDISRINVGAGYYMTDNVMLKAEYVMEERSGNGWVGTQFEDASFSGFNIEAVISF